MTDLVLYANYSPDTVRGFEEWLGREVDGMMAYVDRRSWDQFAYSPVWAYEEQGLGGDLPLYWAVPLTTNGTPLEDVAAGLHDADFRQLAERLAAGQPEGDIVVRLGWEHNGDWYPWSSLGRPQTFIDAYRTAAEEFRSVSDRFVLEWNSNEAYASKNPEPAYPGDDYVDIIGMDVFYNTRWDGTDPVAAFQSLRDRAYGMRWLEEFAAKHDKPTAYSEWGITHDGAGPYIELFADWIARHAAAVDGEGVVYHGFWESDDHLPSYLQDGQHPNAGATFKETFSTEPPPPPTTPEPPPLPGPVTPPPGPQPKPPEAEPPGAPATLEVGVGAHALVLQVSQDAWNGSAKYIVSIDGVLIGEVFTASASHSSGQSDTLTIRGDWADGPRSVSVVYLNDAYGGTPETDRNLYVDGVTYDGAAVANSTGVLSSRFDDVSFAVNEDLAPSCTKPGSEAGGIPAGGLRGADSFGVPGHAGHELVLDFEAAAADAAHLHDVVQLARNTLAGAKCFDRLLQEHISQTDQGVVVDLADGGSMLLKGLNLSEPGAADLVFP